MDEIALRRANGLGKPNNLLGRIIDSNICA
jgi:hypothetical protein